MQNISEITTRIRYAEVDRMGFVYYANYLVFLEMGRTEWLRSKGLTYLQMEEQGIFLPVLDLSATYRKSAKYDDLIRILTDVSEFTHRKIRFQYRIFRSDELLMEASTLHLFMNASGRAVVLPDKMIRLFNPADEKKRIVQ
ncbi:MAG: thioesterase family protein [Candidatus Wallbacteria bacterium]|nr:thioesterase family protein [Candidatus Wallbacteria bacterium]